MVARWHLARAISSNNPDFLNEQLDTSVVNWPEFRASPAKSYSLRLTVGTFIYSSWCALCRVIKIPIAVYQSHTSWCDFIKALTQQIMINDSDIRSTVRFIAQQWQYFIFSKQEMAKEWKILERLKNENDPHFSFLLIIWHRSIFSLIFSCPLAWIVIGIRIAP